MIRTRKKPVVFHSKVYYPLIDINIQHIFNQLHESHSEFGSSLKDFNIVKELGSGSYGIVYKVESIKANKEIFVLKKISMKHLKPKYQLEALQEVKILRELSHPHIIKYYTSFIEEESLFILMEFAAGGDLYSVH